MKGVLLLLYICEREKKEIGIFCDQKLELSSIALHDEMNPWGKHSLIAINTSCVI